MGKIYWCFYRHTGEYPQTVCVFLSAYWRTAPVRSNIYWRFHRRTGEQPKSGATYTGDFIGVLANSPSQAQHILEISSAYWRIAPVRSNIYWRFHRHTGEQPQSRATYTEDFIGILTNSLCQGRMILAILLAYWRTVSVRGKWYWRFYWHNGEQSVSGANDTGDFIGIMANSLCQGQMILAILLA